MRNIEEHIRLAMEAGQFKDLPGRGKPLKLDDNPYENPEWRMAHQVLRNSGFSLPWIEARRDIDAEVDSLRMSLRRSWEWRLNELQSGGNQAGIEEEWSRALKAFGEKIIALNKQITNYNFQAPSPRFQMIPLNTEMEVRKLTA